MRRRFWLEAGFAAMSGILFFLTLAVHDWIEVVFRIDPDRHSGRLEWVIVATLAVSAVVSSSLARRELRRPTVSVPPTR
jgi:hypothetical protein